MELFPEASDLEERDRATLAGLLLESFEGEPDPDVEAAWAEEIDRWLRQIDAGEFNPDRGGGPPSSSTRLLA